MHARWVSQCNAWFSKPVAGSGLPILQEPHEAVHPHSSHPVAAAPIAALQTRPRAHIENDSFPNTRRDLEMACTAFRRTPGNQVQLSFQPAS